MSSGKYNLTEHILYTLLDSCTRTEEDPDYELQEEERASYEATLALIALAEREGL